AGDAAVDRPAGRHHPPVLAGARRAAAGDAGPHAGEEGVMRHVGARAFPVRRVRRSSPGERPGRAAAEAARRAGVGLAGARAVPVLGASLTASVDACLRAGEGGVFGAAFLRAALGGAAGLLAGIVLGAVGFSTFALAGCLIERLRRGEDMELAPVFAVVERLI